MRVSRMIGKPPQTRKDAAMTERTLTAEYVSINFVWTLGELENYPNGVVVYWAEGDVQYWRIP